LANSETENQRERERERETERRKGKELIIYLAGIEAQRMTGCTGKGMC
jgi:hypothetical protein